MEIVIKAVILGVVGAILCLLVQKGSPEIALLLAVSIGILLTLYALNVISRVTDFIELIADASGLSSAIISPMLKTMGIGIVTRLTSDICKDAGQSAIASAVEMVGAASAIYIALPLIQTVFQMIEGLL